MSAQPTQQEAYTTAGNPATGEPAENAAASATDKANKNSSAVADRKPGNDAPVEEATASSLGRGVRGGGPGEEAKGKTDEDVGRHNELDGAGDKTAGEGETADAVDRKSGGGGTAQDFSGDLDRKKAEQAKYKSKGGDDRKDKVDVEAALDGRGAPAAS